MAVDLLDELSEVLPRENVLTDSSELFVYNADGFTIPRATPRAVVFPRNTDEVAQVVRRLNERGIPIVPRGSGTGLTGGATCFNDGVIISTARLNQVFKIDLENRVAHVGAGVRNVQLSEIVAQVPGGAAFHFSPDPSSQRASTVGGNASTNAGGIHCLKDFVTSNHVLGLTMVLPDGRLLKVGSENGAYESPPFDLPGLICGHEGTFGIITELWLRLVPKPTHFRAIVSMFESTSDACRMVSEVIASGLLPSAMEMLDGAMVQILEQGYKFGFPPNAQALVLTEIDGIEELLDEQMNFVAETSRKHHAFSVQSSADAATRAKLWKARKSAFGAVGKISVSYCTQDACVPRSTLDRVLTKVAEIGKRYNIPITNVFHAGDGNIHPIFLYDDRDQKQVEAVLAASSEILQFCIDIGGTLTGEHGVGIEKVGLMEYLFDKPTLDQFRGVKNVFDPREQSNAGKLLPSEKLNIRLIKPGRQAPQ